MANTIVAFIVGIAAGMIIEFIFVCVVSFIEKYL